MYVCMAPSASHIVSFSPYRDLEESLWTFGLARLLCAGLTNFPRGLWILDTYVTWRIPFSKVVKTWRGSQDLRGGLTYIRNGQNILPPKSSHQNMDAIPTSKRAIPDVGASRVRVQLKQLRMVTSDLFLPWKFSMMESRKQSDGGWSCDL